ncbi:MAG: glycosyltransferase family 4 protein [Candidatus Bathyarchaeia archaeon]|jgi:colanic acid biosynthesis glycosyl transferase WcaI
MTSPNLTVLVFAQYFPPDMGGGSARANNVVNGLLNVGCAVTVVAAFPHYPGGNIPERYKHKAVVAEQYGGAKVYRVWVPALSHSSPLKRVILHFCFILSSLFAFPFIAKPDVVWGANPNLFSFFPILIYGILFHVPIVRNVDDLWPEVFYELHLVNSNILRKSLDFLAWLSYVIPVAITPISEGYKRSIVNKYKVAPEKVHVIEVGVDCVKPLLSGAVSANRFIVMYSGVLGLGYDFDIILRSAQILRNKKNIVFIIRGVGELAPKLNQTIHALNLDNVVLDTTFLKKNDLVSLLSSADVFVLPMASLSFVDLGLPTKIFEFQSYAKPIICVSNGESAKYIRSTNSGLLVKPDDAEGLADAIVRLYEDKQLSSKLGLNGLTYVSKNLTVPKIGAHMKSVFSEILSK